MKDGGLRIRRNPYLLWVKTAENTADSQAGAGSRCINSHSKTGSIASRQSYGELTGGFLGTDNLINMNFTF